ncbi:MAG: cytochrome c biogenesis protein ResB [Desulfobacterales bacterium]|nr:cytochrome c biogenesis protein ResB [Desulfobacterales bacterium]
MTQTEKTEPKGILTEVWKFLSSIKLTIVVLLLLAATSVIGTLIPQNAEPAAYLRAYGDIAYRLLRVFDVFDMYHSWWFQALIGLLAANIVVCTARRWPSTWRIVTSANSAIGVNENAVPLAEFSDRRAKTELKTLYEELIGRRYRSTRLEPGEKGFRILAEKGRWTRLGVPAVHLSVVLILAGAMIGSLQGFDGYVNIPEGGKADQIQLRSGSGTMPLGFEVSCEDFNVSYYDSGAPKEYRSSLTILENGRPVLTKDIIVNDPLQYKGINFFQSSYGAMPPSDFELSFTRNATGETLRERVSIGQSVDLPESATRFTIREYRPSYRYKGGDIGETVLGCFAQARR